jgi:hypothetical protein
MRIFKRVEDALSCLTLADDACLHRRFARSERSVHCNGRDVPYIFSTHRTDAYVWCVRVYLDDARSSFMEIQSVNHALIYIDMHLAPAHVKYFHAHMLSCTCRLSTQICTYLNKRWPDCVLRLILCTFSVPMHKPLWLHPKTVTTAMSAPIL